MPRSCRLGSRPWLGRETAFRAAVAGSGARVFSATSYCGSRFHAWLRGIAPRRTHHSASRVAAGAAQEQARQRRAMLRGSRNGTNHEKLIERQFAMMPVTAVDAVFLFDVDRRQQFRFEHTAAQ